MKPILNFDDAGAGADEPAKGVTVGDIRAWHDQYDDLLSSWAECRNLLASTRGLVIAVTQTAGGIVEGYPTSEINILQRIRQLVEIERAAR